MHFNIHCLRTQIPHKRLEGQNWSQWILELQIFCHFCHVLEATRLNHHHHHHYHHYGLFLPGEILSFLRAILVDGAKQRSVKPITGRQSTSPAESCQCDGARPRCSACDSQGLECVYSTNPSESRTSALKRKYDTLERSMRQLEQSHSFLEQLVHALQVREEADATAIFGRLRQGANVESIVQHLRAGDVLTQIHLCPETRLRYDFPYRPQMPSALLIPNNPYLDSVIYKAAFITPETGLLSHSTLPHTDNLTAPYLKPYMAATLADPRLDLVKPSQWTSVSTDDDFLRDLLCQYFLYEYLFFSCFNKDLFLQDMLSGSTQFCSPLLVNPVLALACVSPHICPCRPHQIPEDSAKREVQRLY
jgi:hypothetical protein